MIWAHWVYIFGIVYPLVFYISDLLGNRADRCWSDNTKRKLRVKDDSFLRKIIPIKEGNIFKNGQLVDYRYYLYTTVLPVFIQGIIILLGLLVLIIHFIFGSFIPDLVFAITGGISICVCLAYQVIILTLSENLHL